jgi:hypothetical protein
MTIQIKTFKPTTHKIKALVYGASGSGKTSFAGTAKNAIFLSAEGGLLSIASKKPNYIEIKQLGDLKEAYMYLKTQKHSFDTVIIDSITEINDIVKQDIEKKTGKPMQLQDWGTLAKEIKQQFRAFRDLPMHTVFIAQEMIESQDENNRVSKRVPSLNGKASTEIAYFMDIVGYVFVTPKGEHKVHTLSEPTLLTKDRTGLIGNNTPADFEAWVEKMNTLEIGSEEVSDTFEGTPINTPAKKADAPAQEKTEAPAKAKPTDDDKKVNLLKNGLVKLHDTESITRYCLKLRDSKLYSDFVKNEVSLACAQKVAQMDIDISEVVSVQNKLSADTSINHDAILEFFAVVDEIKTGA